MKKIAIIISLLILIGCKEKHRIIQCLDGDTVVLDDKTHVRIKDIDAPEKLQAGGMEAKHFADSVLNGKEVTVNYSLESSYNRKVAAIEIGGHSFADIIVSEGFAHISKKYCHNEQLINEYEKAKTEHRGLFASNYILPYQFRKQHKK